MERTKMMKDNIQQTLEIRDMYKSMSKNNKIIKINTYGKEYLRYTN